MVPRVRESELFCETNSTPQGPYCTPRNLREESHREHDACLLLIFTYFNEPSQAKSVYLGSGGGKNANTIALR